PIPNRLGSLRPAEKAFRKSSQVQARASNQNGQSSAAANFPQYSPPFTLIIAGCIRFARLADIDHVMRHSRAFFQAGLCSSDVEVFINLNRIVADDLAVEMLRKMHGEIRFPTGRGSHDGDD